MFLITNDIIQQVSENVNHFLKKILQESMTGVLFCAQTITKIHFFCTKNFFEKISKKGLTNRKNGAILCLVPEEHNLIRNAEVLELADRLD